MDARILNLYTEGRTVIPALTTLSTRKGLCYAQDGRLGDLRGGSDAVEKGNVVLLSGIEP